MSAKTPPTLFRAFAAPLSSDLSDDEARILADFRIYGADSRNLMLAISAGQVDLVVSERPTVALRLIQGGRP